MPIGHCWRPCCPAAWAGDGAGDGASDGASDGAGDGAGGLLAFALTAGQAGDAPQAADLLAPLLTPTRQVLAETDAVAMIPPRPNRLQPPHLDPLAYRDRDQVERLINRLKQFRRLATHYDKLAHSYAAFVQLRAITLWLN